MKKYRVEIVYARVGYIEVEEDSEEEAMAKVENMDIEDVLNQANFDPDMDGIDVSFADEVYD